METAISVGHFEADVLGRACAELRRLRPVVEQSSEEAAGSEPDERGFASGLWVAAVVVVGAFAIVAHAVPFDDSGASIGLGAACAVWLVVGRMRASRREADHAAWAARVEERESQEREAAGRISVAHATLKTGVELAKLRSDALRTALSRVGEVLAFDIDPARGGALRGFEERHPETALVLWEEVKNSLPRQLGGDDRVEDVSVSSAPVARRSGEPEVRGGERSRTARPEHLVAPKCPSCGADLKVENGRPVLHCSFCQTDLVVAGARGSTESTTADNPPSPTRPAPGSPRRGTRVTPSWKPRHLGVATVATLLAVLSFVGWKRWSGTPADRAAPLVPSAADPGTTMSPPATSGLGVTTAGTRNGEVGPIVVRRGSAAGVFRRVTATGLGATIDCPTGVAEGAVFDDGVRGGDGAELRFFGGSAGADVSALWSEAVKDDPALSRKVVFKKRGDSWFVVSGFVGDSIFYSKTVVSTGRFARFEFSFPKRTKAAYDPLLGPMEHSFSATGSDTIARVAAPKAAIPKLAPGMCRGSGDCSTGFHCTQGGWCINDLAIPPPQ